MARARLVDENEVEVRIRCTGMGQEEFFGLYHALRKKKLSPAVRNPDPLVWAAQTVHEIMVRVPPSVLLAVGAAVGVVGKDVYGWIKGLITEHLEKKRQDLADRTEIKPLYAANGDVVVNVKRVRPKVKLK